MGRKKIMKKKQFALLQQRRVLELFGKLEWDAAYDYKAERERR